MGIECWETKKGSSPTKDSGREDDCQRREANLGSARSRLCTASSRSVLKPAGTPAKTMYIMGAVTSTVIDGHEGSYAWFSLERQRHTERVYHIFPPQHVPVRREFSTAQSISPPDVDCVGLQLPHAQTFITDTFTPKTHRAAEGAGTIDSTGGDGPAAAARSGPEWKAAAHPSQVR